MKVSCVEVFEVESWHCSIIVFHLILEVVLEVVIILTCAGCFCCCGHSVQGDWGARTLERRYSSWFSLLLPFSHLWFLPRWPKKDNYIPSQKFFLQNSCLCWRGLGCVLQKKMLALTLIEIITSQSIHFPKGIHYTFCNLDINLQYNCQLRDVFVLHRLLGLL